jgi:metallo-beta-lactamase family protein
MKLTFNGAARVVTGSCYLIETGNEKILVECGMFQGTEEVSSLNYNSWKFDPKKITHVLLTHAHIDHSGLIPKLVKEGFTGKIMTTSATRDLCEIMFRDSAVVQSIQEKEDGKLPLYAESDSKKTMNFFDLVEYGKMYDVTPHIKTRFRDAGHILGSAIIEVFVEEGGKTKKITFSGDLGQKGIPIVNDPELIEDTDYLLIESTYGKRLHKGLKEKNEMLLGVIKHTFEKRGKLFIPSFAVERTQELLYRMKQFTLKGVMPKEPVFLDSPLAIRATDVFEKHYEVYDKETKATKKPFSFSALSYTMKPPQSKRLNNMPGPMIIIAGSGMCTAGRIQHHFRNGIDNQNNTVLFVGYQAEGTEGKQIKEGAKNIELFGQNFPIRAEIFSIDAFSGHADYNGLLGWVKGFKKKPKKVFIIHGEEESALSFKEKLEKIGLKAKVPKLYETVEL